MNAIFAGGLALTTIGVLGYAAGIATPYPGRAFAVTAIMVGITTVAIGRAGDRVATE